MTTEILPLGTMPENQLAQVKAYNEAQRQRTLRRSVLELIFTQEVHGANTRVYTNIETTEANLMGLVSPSEIRVVDNTRNCRVVDEHENFLPRTDLNNQLINYGLHPDCIKCEWGINGRGGHNTGCPRLEAALPLYLAVDKIFRPEPIHEEIKKIPTAFFDNLLKKISTATSSQHAYSMLAQPCPQTNLPWYRYTLGALHLGNYINMPLMIYAAERNFRQNDTRRDPKRPFRLLDIACGEGTLTRRISNLPSDNTIKGVKRHLFDEIIGVDINDAMIKAAKKTNSVSNIQYIAGNISQVANQKFDVISFNGLSPYLNSRLLNELIDTFNQILVPNGRVYTSNMTRTLYNRYLLSIKKDQPASFRVGTAINAQVFKLADQERKNEPQLSITQYMEGHGFIMQDHYMFDTSVYPTLDPNTVGMCLVKK